RQNGRLANFSPCTNAATGGEACAKTFIQSFGAKAYRRPLADAEKARLTKLFLARQGTVDYPTRLGLAIQGVLLSPKFLFRPELGDPAGATAGGSLPLTPWELATRLSFLIRGSIPDGELAAVADAGALATPADIRAQAARLLALPESQARLVNFHELWLGVESINALTKDPQSFPQFTPELAFYMGEETRRFLQHVLFTEQGTFADLFVARTTFANGPLASFYGAAAAGGGATDWQRIDLDPSRRSGLLTQASLLATMAKEDRTDPVRRGKFVLERLLCRTVLPPPPSVVAQFKPLDLSKTAREQFDQHKTSTACAACHKDLDPLGLPFEHYDGAGQWRDDDRGMAIDATGQIERRSDAGAVLGTVPFDGIPALGRALADFPDARTCYLAQWFRFATGRLNGDQDKEYLAWLSTRFKRDTKVVDMVAELVQSDSFRFITPPPPPGDAP
ncbi:MAG: DUF1592 domain-containing protein, partial [Pseudomonadota bacterium]